MKKICTALIPMALAFGLFSCSDDSGTGSGNGDQSLESNLILAQVIETQTYLSGLTSLSDSLGGTEFESRAFQENMQFPFVYIHGSTAFIGGYNTPKIIRYERSSTGALSRGLSMTVPATFWASGMAFISESKAYIASYYENMIIVMNPTTMQPLDTIDVSSYSSTTGASPSPAEMVVRDGFVFVALHQMLSGHSTADTVATMLVIDAAKDSVVKMIKNDDYTWPGVRESQQNIFVDENNDIYVNCSGGFGMMGYSAGVLRIKKGETDFDPTYTFPVTGMTVAGATTVTALYGLYYAGGSTAYGFVTDMGLWSSTDDMSTARIWKPAKIDLANKSVTIISEIPATGGFAHAIGAYDGKVFFSIDTKDAQDGIFVYDPTTGKGDSTPSIVTDGIPSFVGAFE